MPKGCVTTHRQSLVSYANFLIEIPMPREQPTLLAVPFFTGFGAHLCFDAPYSRSPMIILRKFEPTAVFQAIERHEVSHMSLVPTMISALCNAPDVGDYDLRTLRLVCYGGSPISASVIKDAARKLKCDFCQLFGTAEAGGLVAYLTPEDHRLDGSALKEKRLLSTGREALYAHIRIIDEERRELGPNQPGELTVKSESTFSGYWQMPEKTAETIRNGWVYTGDVAYRDEDGYIYIVDRKKEMIISGGINIYPAEIEAVLYTHPAIVQAAVIGVPDPHWGEAVKAIVELAPGAQASEADIIEYCRERLASYKKPKSVDFVQGLVSTSGKIAKRELREKYWKGQARRVH
jgi:acyl-CoA synthetase (AMP-forming)/AMP-acid ligase II